MAAAERSNITNGIWLCRKCAKMIDDDKIKYTVELLYEWKRNHEADIEQGVAGSRLPRRIKEMSLRQFETESPGTQQIVVDKPPYWEYLLTVELLRSKLVAVKRQFSELDRGLVYRPSKILNKDQFLTWIIQKLDDLQAIIHLLHVATTEELGVAWGPRDQPGDALEIKYAVDKIVQGCSALLDWEIDVHFTTFPDQHEAAKQMMKGWTEHFLTEIDRIPKEIISIVNQRPKGISQIDLVFRAPSNFDELISAIYKIGARNLV